MWLIYNTNKINDQLPICTSLHASLSACPPACSPVWQLIHSASTLLPVCQLSDSAAAHLSDSKLFQPVQQQVCQLITSLSAKTSYRATWVVPWDEISLLAGTLCRAAKLVSWGKIPLTAGTFCRATRLVPQGETSLSVGTLCRVTGLVPRDETSLLAGTSCRTVGLVPQGKISLELFLAGRTF